VQKGKVGSVRSVIQQAVEYPFFLKVPFRLDPEHAKRVEGKVEESAVLPGLPVPGGEADFSTPPLTIKR
jgi:hypothetical protein